MKSKACDTPSINLWTVVWSTKNHKKISVRKKWVSKRYLIFSVSIYTKLEWRSTLKPLQTSTMIRDDMTRCWCTWPLVQLVKYQSLSLPCAFTTSAPPVKNKLTLTISYSLKALVAFHNDAPNSHVSGINFLEFLVHALSITSHHSW